MTKHVNSSNKHIKQAPDFIQFNEAMALTSMELQLFVVMTPQKHFVTELVWSGGVF